MRLFFSNKSDIQVNILSKAKAYIEAKTLDDKLCVLFTLLKLLNDQQLKIKEHRQHIIPEQENKIWNSFFNVLFRSLSDELESALDTSLTTNEVVALFHERYNPYGIQLLELIKEFSNGNHAVIQASSVRFSMSLIRLLKLSKEEEHCNYRSRFQDILMTNCRDSLIAMEILSNDKMQEILFQSLSKNVKAKEVLLQLSTSLEPFNNKIASQLYEKNYLLLNVLEDAKGCAHFLMVFTVIIKFVEQISLHCDKKTIYKSYSNCLIQHFLIVLKDYDTKINGDQLDSSLLEDFFQCLRLYSNNSSSFRLFSQLFNQMIVSSVGFLSKSTRQFVLNKLIQEIYDLLKSSLSYQHLEDEAVLDSIFLSLERLDELVQESLFSLLHFIAIEMEIVPYRELSFIESFLKKHSDGNTSSFIFIFLIKLLRFSDSYAKILIEMSIPQTLLEWLYDRAEKLVKRLKKKSFSPLPDVSSEECIFSEKTIWNITIKQQQQEADTELDKNPLISTTLDLKLSNSSITRIAEFLLLFFHIPNSQAGFICNSLFFENMFIIFITKSEFQDLYLTLLKTVIKRSLEQEVDASFACSLLNYSLNTIRSFFANEAEEDKYSLKMNEKELEVTRYLLESIFQLSRRLERTNFSILLKSFHSNGGIFICISIIFAISHEKTIYLNTLQLFEGCFNCMIPFIKKSSSLRKFLQNSVGVILLGDLIGTAIKKCDKDINMDYLLDFLMLMSAMLEKDYYGDAISLLFQLISEFEERFSSKKIFECISFLKSVVDSANVFLLYACIYGGLINTLICCFSLPFSTCDNTKLPISSALLYPQHIHHQDIIYILRTLSKLTIPPLDLRNWFSRVLYIGLEESSHLLDILIDPYKDKRNNLIAQPILNFQVSSESSQGFACLQIPDVVHVPLWPPPQGYSFCCWIYRVKSEDRIPLEEYNQFVKEGKCFLCKKNYGKESYRLKCGHVGCKSCLNVSSEEINSLCKICNPPKFYLYQFRSVDGNQITEAFLQDGKIYVKTNTSTLQQLEHQPLEEKQWYFLTLIHQHFLLKPSSFSLYLNGLKQTTIFCSYPNPIQILGKKCIIIGIMGVPIHLRRKSIETWSLGPSYFLNEVLEQFAVNCFYALGPSYDGAFYGDGDGKVEISLDRLSIENLVPLQEYISANTSNNTSSIPIAGPPWLIRHRNSSSATELTLSSCGLSKSISTATPIISLPFNCDSILYSYTARNASYSELLLLPNTYSKNDGNPIAQAMGGVNAIFPKRIADVIVDLFNPSFSIAFLILEQATSLSIVERSIKLLISFLYDHVDNMKRMEEVNGYEIIAYLIREQSKKGNVGISVLLLLLQIVGFTSRDDTTSLDEHADKLLLNLKAFQCFILDSSLWLKCDLETQSFLYASIHSALITGKQLVRDFNRNQLQSFIVVRQLLYLLLNPKLSHELLCLLVDLILVFLTEGEISETDLVDISLFLLSTLTPRLVRTLKKRKQETMVTYSNEDERQALIREMLLKMLVKVIHKHDLRQNSLSSSLLRKVLSPEWISHFLYPRQQGLSPCYRFPTTVRLILYILVALLSCPKYEQLFRKENHFQYLANELYSDNLTHEHGIIYALFCLLLGLPKDGIPHDIRFNAYHLSLDFQMNIQANQVQSMEMFSVIILILRRYSPIETNKKACEEENGKNNTKEISVYCETLKFLNHLYENMPVFQEFCYERKDKIFLKELVKLSCSSSNISDSSYHDEINEDNVIADEALNLLCCILTKTMFESPKGPTLLEEILYLSPDDLLLSPPFLLSTYLNFLSKLVIQLIHSLHKKLATCSFLKEKTLSSNLCQFCSLVMHSIERWSHNSAYSTYSSKSSIIYRTSNTSSGSYSLYKELGFLLLKLILFLLKETISFHKKKTQEKGISNSYPIKKKQFLGLITRYQEFESLSNSFYSTLTNLLFHLYYGLKDKNDLIDEKTTNFLLKVLETLNLYHHEIFMERKSCKSFIYCLCHVLLLVDDTNENEKLKEVSIFLWRYLLQNQRKTMEDILTIRYAVEGITPYSLHLFKGGFDMLLRGNFACDSLKRKEFYKWIELMETPISILKKRCIEEHEKYALSMHQRVKEQWNDLEQQWKHKKNRRKEKEEKKSKKFWKNFILFGKCINSQIEKELKRQSLWKQKQLNKKKFIKRQWKKMKEILLKDNLMIDFNRKVNLGKIYQEIKLRQEQQHVLVERITRTRLPHAFPMTKADEIMEWKLDFTEGPSRMRKKLLLYSLKCEEVLVDDSSMEIQKDDDRDKKEVDERKEMKDKKEIENFEDGKENLKIGTKVLLNENENKTTQDELKISNDNLKDTSLEDHLESFLIPGDEVREHHNCCHIVRMTSIKAIILLGDENFYLVDNYYIHGKEAELEGTEKRIERIEREQNELNNEFHSWSYHDINQIHMRRYQLRHIALEIFTDHGRNYLISFDSVEYRESVFNSLVERCPQVYGASNGLDGTVGGDLYSQLKKLVRNTMIERWKNGEISNFEYLMHLNTLAGRSYNDLTQYPVFPWILNDYESENIDLEDPSVYRDLSKPMGALYRLEEFCNRYESLKGVNTDTKTNRREDEHMKEQNYPHSEQEQHLNAKPFHYGTHYSSAAIVLRYLVRLQPFTEDCKRLQGGKFDHADRLFWSIKKSWESSAGLDQNQLGTQDVQELIPEFFYNADFLENKNNYDFGRKQDGSLVNHVVLPPWAKGSSREFIRVHRQALESEYVSSHLHEWIDLIFGYQQQGQAAINACNVFYFLTYEGAVDLDKVQDITLKAAYIEQINEFGQTPSQLFTSPHPSRTRIRTTSFHGRMDIEFPLLTHMHSKMKNFSSTSSLEVDGLNCPSVLEQPNLLVPELKRIFTSSQIKRSFATTNNEVHSIYIIYSTTTREERILTLGKMSLFLPPRYHEYLCWGYSDQSLRVVTLGQAEGKLGEGKIVSQFELIKDISVACITQDGKILVTGSYEAPSLHVWSWNTNKERITAKKVNLKAILCCPLHRERITSISISREYSVIVSSCKGSTVILWDLNRLRFVRQLLNQPFPYEIGATAINHRSGDILVASGCFLYIFDINGEFLVVGNGEDFIHSLCPSISFEEEWEPQHLVLTGHANGNICVWVYTYKEEKENKIFQWTILKKGILSYHNSRVTALHLSFDHKKIYSADANGNIVMWSLIN